MAAFDKTFLLQDQNIDQSKKQNSNIFGLSTKQFVGLGLGAIGSIAELFGNSANQPLIQTQIVLSRLEKLRREEMDKASTNAIRRLSAMGLGSTGLAQRFADEAQAKVSAKFADIISNVIAQIEQQNQRIVAQNRLIQQKRKDEFFKGLANLGVSLLLTTL